VAVGLAGASRLIGLIASLLYSVRLTNPITFVLTPLPLSLVALATCHFPAWAPTQVDPLMAIS
jgi:hypothetical protein